MKRENLLVELLVEELPPKALDALGNAFGRTLAHELASLGLIADASAHTAFASPPRLAVHVRDVASVAPDVPESKKLMPVKVALDADGKPTVALAKKVQAMAPKWAALLATWPHAQNHIAPIGRQTVGFPRRPRQGFCPDQLPAAFRGVDRLLNRIRICRPRAG